MLLRGGSAVAAEPPAPVPTAPAPVGRATDAVQIDPATLLLFSVTIDGLTLSEGFGAYGDPADPLIPVSELARLLEADIDVLPPERRIVGRVGESRRSLVVDIASGVARNGPQEVRLTEADYAATPTEIYLRVSLIQKILPLKVEVLSDELTLKLTASEKFPVQQRLARAARRPDGSVVTGPEEPSLKIVEPYALFSPPSFDVVLDSALQSGVNDRAFRYDLRFGGDLLYANLQGFIASDEEGRATNARLLLQRRSIEGRLFGPLHVRQVDIGDTFAPGLSLGPRSVGGRGVSFTTVPFERTSVFNRIDLRGELPPGFDVELYINDVLKSSTNQAVNGRYEFLDVPLSPGVNIIRIVTYGPRGERDESVQVVNVGAGLLEKGEGAMVFGIVEQDTPVFRPRSVSAFSSGGGPIAANGGWRVVAGVNYGLAERLTVALGVAHTPRRTGDSTQVGTFGLRTSLYGLATQADAAFDTDGGAAVSAGIAGQFRGVSGVLRHGEYRGGFVDENNTGAVGAFALERRTELTLDSNLELGGRIIPVSMRGITDRYSDGSYDVLAGVRASSSVGPVLLSSGLEYQRQKYSGSPLIERLNGYVAASSFRGFKWQLRTTLDYELIPDLKPRLATITADRKISDRFSLRLAAAEPLDNVKGWNGVVSGIYQTRYGDFALTGEYDNNRSDWRIGAQWSFGLGYNPRRGYQLTRSGPGSGGSAILEAFVDENGDGVRQPSEKSAPGVVVQGGQPRERVTGEDGRVYVTGLGAGASARLDVNLERIDLPSVQTPPLRVDLQPRPGRVSTIPFPMRPTGEVLIRVDLLRDDGKTVGLSSVRLQLVPETGQAVEEVTEFDGTAVFDALPIGNYRLQLEPRQAEKLRMHLIQTPSVQIKGDGSFTPDIVVQVKFDPPPAGAAAPGGR